MPIRVDPATAQARDVPILQGLDDEKAQRKLSEIQAGGQVLKNHPDMPRERPMQDVLWTMIFLAVVGLIIGTGFLKFDIIMEEMERNQDNQQDGIEFPPGRILVASVVMAVAGSVAAAFACIIATERMPACMVWTSLIFGPCLMIVLGLGLMLMNPIFGFIAVAIGACSLFCVCFCYRDLIPFTIALAEVVAKVIEHNPCMFSVALVGSAMSVLWTVACTVAFLGLAIENRELLAQAQEGNEKYVLVFVCAFTFTWGAQVACNVCHVTYCYVFGAWYYGKDDSPLMPGLRVATLTSFGSICFGSFLVAFVRALEAVARTMRRDAQEEGNYVVCIIACILEVIISCIGDILEYFNDWAYVQCAVRGVSFMDAAKITYSMMTCANVQFIIRDLLLDSLVGCGSFFCGAIGAASGAATGWLLDGNVAAMWGAILGLIIGMMTGVATLSSIGSGVKTILACWADDSSKLQNTHPDVAAEFERRIQQGIYG